jgi:hypothetical protein
MKIKDILVFFVVFLKAKMDGWVQIESGTKLRVFEVYGRYFKTGKNSGVFSEVSPKVKTKLSIFLVIKFKES